MTDDDEFAEFVRSRPAPPSLGYLQAGFRW